MLFKYKNVNIKIRSGSSFTGDLLSAHPNAAYYFEPFYLLRPGGHSIERALQEVYFSYLIFIIAMLVFAVVVVIVATLFLIAVTYLALKDMFA